MKRTREKLSMSRGLRLAPSVAERLAEQARMANIEDGELARQAVEAELARREDEQALLQVARLRAAGIDLQALVDFTLAKQAQERAQAMLPGIFTSQKGDRA